VSEHLSLDELAELDAGLLARGRHRAATRHVAECEECAARAEAIGRTRERLRDIEPVTMPPDVAARIDRALNDATASSGSDVVPDLGEHRARRFGGIPPWAYAAAAAVVVLGGTAIAIGTRGHSSPSAASATVAEPLVATAATPSVLSQQQTGRTYSPDNVTDLATGLVTSSAADSAAPSIAGAAPELGSGGGAAGGKRSDKGAARSAPMQALAAPVPLAPSLQRLVQSPSALLQCAAFITDTANASPLAVDFGRWTNADAGIRRVPAIIFVFADPDDSTVLDVWVVKAACDDTSVLSFRMIDRAQ
jgi:hypothetical protein